MVLAETLTSAESTALTFDFAHTLQLVQILLGFICYQHLILYVFVIMYPDCSRISEQQPQFSGISPVAALQVSM